MFFIIFMFLPVSVQIARTTRFVLGGIFRFYLSDSWVAFDMPFLDLAGDLGYVLSSGLYLSVDGMMSSVLTMYRKNRVNHVISRWTLGSAPLEMDVGLLREKRGWSVGACRVFTLGCFQEKGGFSRKGPWAGSEYEHALLSLLTPVQPLGLTSSSLCPRTYAHMAFSERKVNCLYFALESKCFPDRVCMCLCASRCKFLSP